MKTKKSKELNLTIVVKNKPDLSLLDSYFYSNLYNKIKEDKIKLTNLFLPNK